MTLPTLYAHHLSGPSWRVLLSLVHKKIPHKIRVIDFTKNETRTPTFLNTINPTGQIPVMDIGGGRFIRESLAILEYLEEAYPQTPPLLPTDDCGRAKVREICNFIGSGIHPLQTAKVAALHSPDREEQLKWTKAHITQGFDALEKILQKTTGHHKKFCFLEDLTMADMFLGPQVYNAVEKYKMSLDKAYPTIWSIYMHLDTNVDTFTKTHPRNGPLS